MFKKILVSICLMVTFLHSAKVTEKTTIEDIHSLVIVYESFLINVHKDRKTKEIKEYLNLIDLNNKNQVILAISRLENEVENSKSDRK